MNWRALTLAVLIAANAASALAVVATRHGNRMAFLELRELEARRDLLEVEWGQLQLEQSAWATHGRVEQLAHEQLNMVIPSEGDVVVVE